MSKAIIGKKLGMTQIFSQDGKVIPVTVVEAGPCPIVQIKTLERDGYTAIKLGFDETTEKRLTKPALGQFKKAGVAPQKVLKEFRVEDVTPYEVGKAVTVETFAEGDKVDVSGVSKGHGYTGVIKRWNNHRLKETHGVGPVHREVGSMGANSTPSRVFKGKKMPGLYLLLSTITFISMFSLCLLSSSNAFLTAFSFKSWPLLNLFIRLLFLT